MIKIITFHKSTNYCFITKLSLKEFIEMRLNKMSECAAISVQIIVRRIY